MADLLGIKFEGDVVRTIEFEWHTFEGVVKKISQIDHQHLSNIIYFMKYVGGYGEDVKSRMQDQLDTKFQSNLLPWRPLRRFEGEMNFLKSQGWLKEEKDKTLIIINGELIGQVAEE